MRSETAIARVHEATTSLRAGTLRSLRRLRPCRLGPTRRTAADRRHQSARHLEVLLRGPERSASAGRPRPRTMALHRRGIARGCVCPVLPPRTVRSARRTNLPVQHRPAVHERRCDVPGDRLPAARDPCRAYSNHRRAGATRRAARASTRPPGRSTGASAPIAASNRSVSITCSSARRFRHSRFRKRSSRRAFLVSRWSAEISRRSWGSGASAERSRRSCATTSRLEAASLTGSSVDAGVGVDRKAGDYRFSGTVLYHREDPDLTTGCSAAASAC